MKKIALLLLAFTVIFCANAQNKKDVQTIVIQTNGVCGKCQSLITESITSQEGIKECKYDAATSKVTVAYNPSKTTPDKIRQAISKTGYNADNMKADAAARAKLPACCRAEKGAHSSCDKHTSCQGAKNNNQTAPAKKNTLQDKQNTTPKQTSKATQTSAKKATKTVEKATEKNTAAPKKQQ